MYEDDPQDKVFDVLGEAVFGEHPLGRRDHRPRRGRRRHAGRRARAPSTPRATCPRNVVIAAAGSVDHDALVELVARARRRGRPPPRRAAARRAADGAPRAVRFDPQGHRAVPRLPRRARASPRDDERRFALRVLDTILGGTSSSRLFQEVREQRGLAYARLLVQRAVRRHRARSASTSARGPTTSRAAHEVVGRRARAAASRPGDRRGARPREGERQGPRRARRWSRRARG